MASISTIPTNPTGSLRERCSQCSATGEQLFLCSGCRAVRFCGRAHQTSNWPEHKALCHRIKRERAKVAKEEDLVRNATDDFMTPANAFETAVGNFWDFYNTRPYMRARFALADDLRLTGTLDGAREALVHFRDMLRLCRGDNLGIRDVVPALMLRLDLDQECYDFVKWWQTHNANGTYDYGDMSQPYLDLHGADALETPDFFGDFTSLNHIVSLLLLKMKLLIDIRNIKVARKIPSASRLPTELVLMLEPNMLRSPLSKTMFQGKTTAQLLEMEAKLVRQTCLLGGLAVETNQHFVADLLDADLALGTEPTPYSKGSWEQSVTVVKQVYGAFYETEGVLELLHDARACAAMESEVEIPDFMKGERRRNPQNPRTPEEMLKDVSINRIWGYLDYAVENASYLGTWSERPSVQHYKATLAQLAAYEDEDDEDDEADDDEGLDGEYSFSDSE
ncbi:zinc finger domain-containing mynd-type [Ophiostoma piceae UAMH 11346]|uniref:Zinc finger domain-containing mynd-type n=1 Tax=Ophiostoma piceae (strain UAMH 11346) TaxID=1262450 RepID=S3C2D0_OPHP1|nr:zinc finger domain-containing mynd-type [Ophiostoma piceae UAMH 11346]